VIVHMRNSQHFFRLLMKNSYHSGCLMTGLMLMICVWTGDYLAHGSEFRRGELVTKVFDHRQEPSREDWRYFLRLDSPTQDRIWRSFSDRHIQLKDWSWAWRLGWVRACNTNRRDFCDTVLREALTDRALVVRAEAVSAYGRIFENTERADVVHLMAQVAKDKRNLRHQKPLFIQKRIIFALHSIGGRKAEVLAKEISNADHSLKSYYAKIFR